MGEGGQAQIIRHRIQPVLSQIEKQVLGKDQRIHTGLVKRLVHPAAGRRQKAEVKGGIMGGERPSGGKAQKRRNRLGLSGRVRDHFVRDAGKGNNLRREGPSGICECLEGIGDLTALQDHRADFCDSLGAGIQTCGLQVEADHGTVHGASSAAAHYDTVVHVVIVIGLHAVEDFYFSL
ncbi:hypothetical protein SDC9_55621 [bioreactor metagenome]|uniref:Uncharacterized protein n=1 Tax=bioreactor metagenome TaxID=1076179 RepID=A0A644WZG2_9ZZZZ